MASPEERYEAAESLKNSGDLAGAVAELEALTAEHPGYSLAYSAMAAWCTRLEPQDPFSYTALSVACMRAGLIPEAEDALARSRMLQQG